MKRDFKMFLTVCLNPTLQKTLCFSSLVPDSVNRAKSHRLDVSGKGINVTRVLTQLGHKAVHLTQLGGVMRPLFLSLCEQDKLSVEWVESSQDDACGSEIRFCYTTITDDGTVTELVEEGSIIEEGSRRGAKLAKHAKEEFKVEEDLFSKFDSLISERDFSWVIISGTKAAGFSDAIIPEMVRKAKEKGLKVILDVKGKDLINSLQYKPDIIKPNLSEFKDTDFSLTLNSSSSSSLIPSASFASFAPLRETSLQISKTYSCKIILTDGSGKISAADKDDFFQIDVVPVKAVNTIGCGDAFTAGLASALESGAQFRQAIAEGMRCGALNAGFLRPGVIC